MHSSAAFSFLGYASSSLQNLLLGSQNLVDTRDLLGTISFRRVAVFPFCARKERKAAF